MKQYVKLFEVWDDFVSDEHAEVQSNINKFKTAQPPDELYYALKDQGWVFVPEKWKQADAEATYQAPDAKQYKSQVYISVMFDEDMAYAYFDVSEDGGNTNSFTQPMAGIDLKRYRSRFYYEDSTTSLLTEKLPELARRGFEKAKAYLESLTLDEMIEKFEEDGMRDVLAQFYGKEEVDVIERKLRLSKRSKKMFGI